MENVKEHDAPEENEESNLRQRKVGAEASPKKEEKSPKPEEKEKEKLERQR